MKTTLIVAPHPDDEVLGCGGTIPLLVQNGHTVLTLILGEGITSRYEDPAKADPSSLASLRENSRAVASLLGVRELYTHDFPDNRFDMVPLLDIVKVIEALVDKAKPEWMFIPSGGDLNIDHKVTYQAALTATRPMPGMSVRRIYAYEVASSTDWTFKHDLGFFHPNTFWDISSTLDKKLKAMELYSGEIREFPHPRSAKAIQVNANRWGSISGFEAAEPFELIRDMKS